MADAIDTLKEGLKDLYKSQEFVDFTIICGPHKFGVHKVVVAAQSSYFRSLFKSTFKDVVDSKIELKARGSEGADEACDDADAIALMVQYFYHLNYTGPSLAERVASNATDKSTMQSNAAELGSRTRNANDHPKGRKRGKKKISSFGHSLDEPFSCGAVYESSSIEVAKPSLLPASDSAESDMITHARVFVAADKYDAPGLRKLAAAKFKRAVTANWDHESFAEAAYIVFTSADTSARDLRDVVVSTIHNQSRILLNKPEVAAVICSTDDLCFELLRMSYGLPAAANVETNRDSPSQCEVQDEACDEPPMVQIEYLRDEPW